MDWNEGCGMRYGAIRMFKKRLEQWCAQVLHSWLKGAVNIGTPNTQLPRQEASWQQSKPLFPKITIEHKTTLHSFQPLKSGISFHNMLKFWESRFTWDFFLRQQKNCLENSNRRRENLTAEDASAICIFILAAQDFKLKTQPPPHYLFPYAKRKWKILCTEKNASCGNCPTLSSSVQSLKDHQSPGPGAWRAGGQEYSRFSSWNACQVWRYCGHTHMMVWIKSNLHFFFQEK